jgi:transcriptional regulator with XRE-family HTH domain
MMAKRQIQQSLRSVFAKNLRKFRKEMGLSQERLAELSGLHRTFVGCVERSEKNVSIDSIERFANALGKEARDLFLQGE